MVNSRGDFLLGFDVNPDGTSSSVSLSTATPVIIPTSSGAPSQTNEVDLRMNLPAGDAPITVPFDPTDPLTYNNSTSVTIFDSLGDSHIMTYYFIKTAANTWNMQTAIDGNVVPVVGGETVAASGGAAGGALAANTGIRMNFSSGGQFVSQVPAPPTPSVTAGLGATFVNGADATQEVRVNFNLGSTNEVPTQYSGNFEVTSLEQDGLPVGQLTGIDIGTDGLVVATYSNGTAQPLSRIALVAFANDQGLTQVGNTAWKESLLSGEALAGEAGAGTFGSIRSSALEQSNVNLTNELIDLISAQRNFQANSRSLEVSSQLDQTILQIR